ncbi:unnamed protein product [Somion occarium]|uniref:Arrestin-like N-terminal domain-containing protein n=1 Tax=Somion occarium TaxID=3059160 RepID=A0ABP1EAQ2_9APHY
MQPNDSELPGYTSYRANRVEFSDQTCQLEDGKGRPWIWLTIRSRTRDRARLPLFCEGDKIEGSVEVDFDKTSGAKGVSVAVTGSVTEVGQEEFKFLQLHEALWTREASTAPKDKHRWPFSIPLPDKVPVQNESYALPPSFSERGSPVYVDYRVTVAVRRGGLRVNHTLASVLVYMSTSYAPMPSQLRQLAYSEGAMIIGPEGDPEGWKTLQPLRISGTLFNTKPVTVECTLAISSPVAFAAGSPIPLFMTFSSVDEQALDLLSTPSSIKIHLIRERLVGSSANKGKGQTDRTFREPISAAFFWSPSEASPEKGKRVLQGELEVKKGTTPSFTFHGFL